MISGVLPLSRQQNVICQYVHSALCRESCADREGLIFMIIGCFILIQTAFHYDKTRQHLLVALVPSILKHVPWGILCLADRVLALVIGRSNWGGKGSTSVVN